MATETQHANIRRRRSRTIAFFDHGERLDQPRHVRFVEPRGRPQKEESKVERYLPYIRCGLHAATWVLATLALLGPAILIFASGVRGLQLLCSHNVLGTSNAICNSDWTRPQTALLQRLPEGTTPLSATFREFEQLHNIHTSIDFMGLPLFTVVQNLSTTLPEIEQIYKDTPILSSSLDTLSASVATANDLVETLGNLDHDFRQSFLWNPEATNDFVGSIEGLLGTIDNSSRMLLSAKEAFLHVIPLASESSFSYLAANQYYQFLDLHQLTIEDLAKLSTEAKLALQEVVGLLGQLERELEKFNLPKYADDIKFMRLSSKWVEAVVQDIETRYRNIHHSVQEMHRALRADLSTYHAWWLSRGYVPLTKLRDVLTTEMAQLTALEERSMEIEERTNDMYKDMLGEDFGQNRFRSQLEAGILNRQVDWYTKSEEL